MKDGCLKPEEIVIALSASEDDPRHQHLKQCPWCQALAASLDLFQRDGELPAGADMADAEARLEDFLQREIVEKDGSRGIVSLPAAGSRRRLGPILLAAAAVLAVVVGLPLVLDRDANENHTIRLRSQESAGRLALQLTAPERQADGNLQITWSPLESATGYQLLLLDSKQQEAARIEAGVEISRVLTPDDLGALAGRPSPWFVVVVARIDADELSRSLPRLLPQTAGEKR